MAKFNFQYAFPAAKAQQASSVLANLQKAHGNIPSAETATRAGLLNAVNAMNDVVAPDWLGVEKVPVSMARARITTKVARLRAVADLVDIAVLARHRVASHQEANVKLDTMVQKLQARQINWFETNGFNSVMAFQNDVYKSFCEDMVTMFVTAADTAEARLMAFRGTGLTAANLRDMAMVINAMKATIRGSGGTTPKPIVVPLLTSVKAREEFFAMLKRSKTVTITALTKKVFSKAA